MPRKKISTRENDIGNVADLDDNEELVIENTKRVRRERKPPPEPVSDDTHDVIDAELIDDDDGDEGDDAPAYSQTSLAAMIYGETDEDYSSEFCTVSVRRNPDAMSDRFLNPCSSLTNLPPIRNIELTAEKMDIEERVREQYGGGHYFFQVHYEGRLRKSWQATLSDSPEAVERDKQIKAAAATLPPPAAPVEKPDPMSALINNLSQMSQLKQLLFGDEQQRYERELAELRAQIAAKSNEPAQPISEQVQLFQMAMNAPAPLQERILDRIAPPDENGNRHWAADLVSVALEHKDTLAAVLGGLLGAAQPHPQQASIEDMMRMSPPPQAVMPPPPQSGFRRRTENADGEITPMNVPAADESAAEPADDDSVAINAEPVHDEETEQTDGKRKRRAGA
jgi:hypothetical protein